MKAWDFDCVAYDSDFYCVECLPDGVDSEDSELVTPVFASDELDYYPVCCVCGKVHEYMVLIEENNNAN